MMKQNRFASLVGTITLLAGLAGVSQADDWPHWRGPQRNGVSAETGWLDQWPAGGPPVAWKAAVGTGFSSFAVAGGRVFTMGHAGGNDTVFCLDAESGKEIWKHSYPAALGDNLFEGGPTATPTVEGGRVYTLSRWGDVFCFDAVTGKVHWSKNVQKETEAPVPQWGFSGSPVPHDNLLLLDVGEAGLALEKATGKIVWQSAKKEAGYSTPLPLQRGGARLAVFSSGQAYIAADAATGKEAWRVRWVTQYGVNAADPIIAGDQMFISTGYGKGATLVKLGAAEPAEVWKNKVLRTQLNAAVPVGAHVYGIDGDTGHKGGLRCVELATGAQKWAQPDLGYGSVIAAGGKLIVLTAGGELVVAPASPDGFKATARAKVLGGKCWTVPVLANGRLYCRNAAGDVVCVDLRKK
jgi:outer membrane protein assembly factor BamB